MTVHHLQCCGVKELGYIRFSASPADVLEQLRRSGWNERARFFIFTQADYRRGKAYMKQSYGVKLAAYIEQYKLGEVTRIGAGSNPNSTNMLTMWVWKINSSSFTKHANKLKWQRPTNF